MQAKNAYPVGMDFQQHNDLATIQLMSIQQTLNTEKRSLETIIKDFYENHLKEKHNYPAPQITIPPLDADYVTKIRTLTPEMDAIVKHYNTFVDNGSIDLELITMSKPLNVTDGKSLLKIRNVYAIQDYNCNIHEICRLLFSEQSSISHIKEFHNKNYGTFFDVMNHEKVNYNSFSNFQIKSIDFLIKQCIISIDEDNFLYFSNINQLKILYLLWKYQVISYWQCNKEIRTEIDNMIDKGWIESDGLLLSKQEQEWFSYYLNNTKFTNGPAIRNIVQHGANTMYTEEEMQRMYYRIIMLFISLLYKIELDLRLANYINTIID